jgi:hypothetical protein
MAHLLTGFDSRNPKSKSLPAGRILPAKLILSLAENRGSDRRGNG